MDQLVGTTDCGCGPATGCLQLRESIKGRGSEVEPATNIGKVRKTTNKQLGQVNLPSSSMPPKMLYT